MIKRGLCLFSAILLLSSLCIPCAAADTWPLKQRGYPGFSDIPSIESPYFASVKTCYEFGWLDAASEEAFGIYEPLKKSEMITLLARLYSVRHGGRGTIPALPENLDDYVRFYDADGTLVHNLDHYLDFIASSPTEMTVIFWEEELRQKTLTMEVGFPGDGIACTASGIRIGIDAENSKTTYVFTFPDSVNAQELSLEQYRKDIGLWQTIWQTSSEQSNDPRPYDAILYLLYREPAHLPWCLSTLFLDENPYGEVCRAEFAVPLSGICAGLPEDSPHASAPDLPGEWADSGDIPSLYRMGILRGIDAEGTFAGRECLTRGQAAIMADRALDLIEQMDHQAK